MSDPSRSAQGTTFSWLVCNCAATPPTMPTCRGKHLPTCPRYVYDAVVLWEQRAREYADKSPPKPGPRGRPGVDAARAIHGAEAITLTAVRALMEGIPTAESHDGAALDQTHARTED